MYTLHFISDWASVIVHLTLQEMGLPHALRALDPDAGDLASPGYLALNPRGLVPVLETPEGPIFETGAILLWLAERHGRFAVPAGDADRAAFLSWFFFTANTLHPEMMALVHPERPAGPECEAQVMRAAQAQLMTQFAHLDRALAQHPWLAEPSILTIYVCVILRWCRVYVPDAAFSVDIAAFPNLQAMARRMEVRPAVQRVADLEGLGPTPFSAPVPAA